MRHGFGALISSAVLQIATLMQKNTECTLRRKMIAGLGKLVFVSAMPMVLLKNEVTQVCF